MNFSFQKNNKNIESWGLRLWVWQCVIMTLVPRYVVWRITRNWDDYAFAHASSSVILARKRDTRRQSTAGFISCRGGNKLSNVRSISFFNQAKTWSLLRENKNNGPNHSGRKKGTRTKLSWVPIFLEYATCTSPIMHLICHPIICISIVFHFSWDGCNTQEKWKRKVMQNSGGQIRCIMGDVEVAYRSSSS